MGMHVLTAYGARRTAICVVVAIGLIAAGCGKKEEPAAEAEPKAEPAVEAPAEAAKPAEPAAAPEPKPAADGPISLAQSVTLDNVLYAEGVNATLVGDGEMTLKLTVTNQRKQTLRIKLRDVLAFHPDPEYPVLHISVKKIDKKERTLTVKAGATESIVFEQVTMVRHQRQGEFGGPPPPPQPEPVAIGPDRQPLPPDQVKKKKKKKKKVPGVLDELARGQRFHGFASVPTPKKPKRSGGGPGGVPGEFAPPPGGDGGGGQGDPRTGLIKEYTELRKAYWDPRLADLRSRANNAVQLAGLLREILDTPMPEKKGGKRGKKSKKKRKPGTLATNGYLAAEASMRLIRAVMATYPRGLAWMDDKGAQDQLNRAAFETSWKLVSDRDLRWALDKQWQRQRQRKIQQHVTGRIASLTDVKLRPLSRTVGPDRFVHMMIRCRQLQQVHAIVFGKESSDLTSFKSEVDRYFPDCYMRWAREAMKKRQYTTVASVGQQALRLMGAVEAKDRLTKMVATAQQEHVAKKLYDDGVARARAGRYNDALGLLEQAIAKGRTDHLEKAKDEHAKVLEQAEKVAEKIYSQARAKQLAWYPMAAYQLYGRVVSDLPKTRAARRARGNMKYLKERFLDKAKALLKKAEAALEEEEFDDVRKNLRELSVLGKDLPERERISTMKKELKERIGTLARKLQSRARRAELLKDYKTAIKWYKRILAMDPHGSYSLQAEQKIQYLKAKLNN